ncbi:MAG: hypothetical protein LBM70_09335 [Victivallales bacterium]|jgi:hypothetical protein|nr:hypothetical protein [Victivallales bacterium]
MKNLLQQCGKTENLMLYLLDYQPEQEIPEYIQYQLRKYSQGGIRILLFLTCPSSENDAQLVRLKKENIIADFVCDKGFFTHFAVFEQLLKRTESKDFENVGNLIITD